MSRFRADLGLFDFTLLVIGAVIGDGIYVVASMGSQSLGPAQLIAWLVGGVLAAFIALAFVQCAAIDPEVGGSYSYARVAFGPLVGFLAGWTLYAGEWLALSAFPRAFFNYFQALTGAPNAAALPVKLLLIVTVTGVNLLGVRQGARTNDALTTAKLLPLAVLAVSGLVFLALHFGDASAHLHPFTPVGWGGFGKALLPIFWAYAGFELAVLPAGEVRSAQRTLPRGLLIGMAVAIVIYLTTSLAVVISLPWQDIASSKHPLALALEAIVSQMGGPASVSSKLMSLGGLISIAGVCVVFTLGLARLSYSLAFDGFLPAPFATLHSRYRTPYVGLFFQAGSAIILSTLLDLRTLLSTAVVFLSICYFVTSLSALRLIAQQPARRLHIPGLKVLLLLAAASSLFLTAQASLLQLLVGSLILLVGLGLYAHRQRWQHAGSSEGERLPIDSLGEHHGHTWLWRSVQRHLQAAGRGKLP